MWQRKEVIKTGERIKELRKALKLSQTEFGKRLGVSRDVINNIENGRVELKEYLIKTIVSVFNVSADWLRTGEGEMKSESDEDMLSRIAGEMNLTPLQTEAFKILMGLPEEDREVVAKAFFAILKSITKRPASPPVRKAYHELSDDEKVSRYKEQLKDEKKGPREESSVSTIGK